MEVSDIMAKKIGEGEIYTGGSEVLSPPVFG